MAKYRISVSEIKCIEDQRTQLINFEGKLEVQSRFTVNGAIADYPSNSFGSRNNFQLNKGESVFPNLSITEIEYSAGQTPVTIFTEIRELEFGGQGSDDQGSKEDTIVLNGADSISKVVTVNISADNRKERGGKISVTFVANKI